MTEQQELPMNAVATRQDQPVVNVLDLIARAASDPNTDVAKLEKLLEMRERIEQKDAEKAFNDAMRDCQKAIRPVLKNRENTETRSKYADLEQVSNAIDPTVNAHGFTLSYGTADSPLENHYRVTCRVSHEAGFSRDYQADVPIDNTGPKGAQNKTRTHGFGSALSYGRRYLKLMIFDVRTTDDDGNAAGLGEPINDEQVKVIQQLIDLTGADTRKFCQYLRVDGVPSITHLRYQEAVAALRRRDPAKVDAFLMGENHAG